MPCFAVRLGVALIAQANSFLPAENAGDDVVAVRGGASALKARGHIVRLPYLTALRIRFSTVRLMLKF